MAPSPDDFDHTLPPAGSPRSRDRGLRRTRRISRWIAVAAVAGAAALGSLYTHLLPGSSASPAQPNPPVQNPTASASRTTTGGDDEEHRVGSDHEDDGDDDEGAAAARPAPQPPAQPPTATRQQPHTTTGAS